MDREIILGYLGGPSVIASVLERARGRPKWANQRDGRMRRTWPNVAGFEDGARGP